MAGVAAVSPKFYFPGAEGGSVDVYIAGTTTRANTWQDRALTTANTNPVVLNARAECVLWLDPAIRYKFVVNDSGGATIYVVDNVTGAESVGEVAEFAVDRFSGTSAEEDYTLSVTPDSGNTVDVFVDGVYQQKNTYTLAGNTLTITAATGTNNVEAVTKRVLDSASFATSMGELRDDAGSSASSANTSAGHASSSASAAATSATNAASSASSASSSAGAASASALAAANSEAAAAGNAPDGRGVSVSNYTALRAYNGVAATVKVLNDGIAGDFVYDIADSTSSDDDGTVIVASDGKRWKRVYDGKLRPEYFGADPDVTFSYDPTAADGTPTGDDSTAAFQAMMTVAQTKLRAVISLKPGAVYYVTGDNPCGVQTSGSTSCPINIEGNNARIYWRPTLTTDSMFGKLGLLYTPEWKNFRVYVLGEPGDRLGTIFNTKLGYSQIHFFSQAHFDNILVNAGDSIGCDKVFNFEDDGTASHDDLSVFEGVYAVNFNTFCKIKNGESVANVFRRCVTFAYTDNAITYDVDTSISFRGYLDIDRHAGAFFNAGETFLKTKAEDVLYPIYVRSPRMEKRADVAYKLFDLGSCRVVVSGWSSALGSNSTYFDNTNQYIKIGQYATMVMEDCFVVDGNIQIDAGQQRRAALITKRCTFYRHYASAWSAQPFPKIKWGTYSTRTAALAAGAQFNYVLIDEPDSQNNLPLPLSFSRRNANDKHEVVICTLLSTGKASLNGANTIPEDVVFESLYLRVEDFVTTNVDELKVLVTTSTGGFIKTYTVAFSGSAVGQELITSGKVLTIPVEGAITYAWYKSAVQVTDSTLFPEARIEARYRTTLSSREGNAGTGAEIDVV